jgi:hypothetical protein
LKNAISLSASSPVFKLWVGLVLMLLLAEQELFAQSLASTQGLSFGSFIASNGGSITVSPSGARSQSGTVGLLTSRGASSAAQFSFTGGASGAAFSLGLPADNAARLVLLSTPNLGGASMALTQFVSSVGPSATLSLAGAKQFSVGATLLVQPNQPLGEYGATFNVTVQFN